MEERVVEVSETLPFCGSRRVSLPMPSVMSVSAVSMGIVVSFKLPSFPLRSLTSEDVDEVELLVVESPLLFPHAANTAHRSSAATRTGINNFFNILHSLKLFRVRNLLLPVKWALFSLFLTKIQTFVLMISL